MPGFSKLSLRLQEHAPTILKHFDSLRRGRILCDCVLVVGGKEFPLHRSLLVACSPYFQALFTSKMKETGSPSVTISGVSAGTFEVLLDFVYTGEVSLSEDNVTDIFPAAELFQLEGLQDICCDYFVNQLCASNCLGIWRYAQNYSNRKVEKAAWFYIASHFMELVATEEFFNLSKEELCKVLSSDDLDLPSEMDAYKGAMSWLLHDLARRKQDVMDVLSCVRLPLVNPQVLSSLASADQLNPFDKSCKEIMIQAKNAQRLRSTKSRQKMSAFKKQSLTPRKSARSMTVVGGYSGDIVRCSEVYDEKSNSWRESDVELSMQKQFHWIGVIGMRLYALGGDSITNINQVMSKFTTSAASLLQTTALSTEWECEAVLPHDCSSMRVCVMNECMYTCGETTLDNTPVYAISCYDPSGGTWELLSTLPQARVSAGFISYSGKLYLTGGMDPNSGAVLTSLESYDPTTYTWESLPNCSTGRYHMGSAVLSDCIYLIGGIGDESGEINIQLKTVECYSFKSKAWSLVASLDVPRAGMAVCVWMGRIFTIGGETADSVHSDIVEEFDPETGQWTTFVPLKNTRIYPSAIIV